MKNYKYICLFLIMTAQLHSSTPELEDENIEEILSPGVSGIFHQKKHTEHELFLQKVSEFISNEQKSTKSPNDDLSSDAIEIPQNGEPIEIDSPGVKREKLEKTKDIEDQFIRINIYDDPENYIDEETIRANQVLINKVMHEFDWISQTLYEENNRRINERLNILIFSSAAALIAGISWYFFGTDSKLQVTLKKTIKENELLVADYKNGDVQAFDSLLEQAIIATDGKIDHSKVATELKNLLDQ